MNSPQSNETLVIELTRRERAVLEALGRKTGIPVELAILTAIADYVTKKRSI